MIWLTRIALKKRWVTIIISALLAGASIWATLSLNMELFPDIDLPMTTIITVYPQAPAEKVMEEITIPVEEAVSDIKGLQHIISNSSESSSLVFVQFEYGTDMDEANGIMAEKLDALEFPQIVRELPAMMQGLDENPRLLPINVDLMPIVILSLGGDVSSQELQQIAYTEVATELEAIEGVFSVSVEGAASEEIMVSLDVERMTQSGISMGQLAGILSMRNYESVADVQNLLLSPDGLQLKDLALVSFGLGSGESISRTNGKPSISINLHKEADANTVEVANAVIAKVEELGATLPSGMELLTVFDQSEFIENSISDLTNSALIGAGLAVVIVFIFLMAVRASVITVISIPLSVLIGFFVMRFTNITINILTLSAMVIAVGRVIDNSIVILEVIYRHLQQGEGFMDAAINGTREVVLPITSATIATVVIFLPLGLVGGIVGELFIPFGLTITFALIGSLLIALTIIPALSGWLSVKRSEDNAKVALYQRAYTAMLKWCLNHKVLTLSISTVLFLGSFALMPIIGTSFIPEMNTDMITIQIGMPEGSSFDDINQAAREAENLLAADPDVEVYSTTIGSSGGAMGALIGFFTGGGTNTVTIQTVITPAANSDEVAGRLYDNLSKVIKTGTTSVSTQQAAMSAGMTSSLEITLRGDTYEDVVQSGKLLLTELESASQGNWTAPAGSTLTERRQAAQAKNLESLTDLQLDTGNVESMLVIAPDPVKLMSLGLTEAQIGMLQQEFMLMERGGAVAEANVEGISYEIFLEGIMQKVTSPEMAGGLMIGAPVPIPLSSVATILKEERLTEIQRFDQKISATISGSIGEENVGAVNMAVQSVVDSLSFPSGIEISMGGIAEDMSESFSSMFISIGIAIGLVYIVLVATFRSLRNPLIIMMSLPLASIGALLGLLITGRTLGVTGLMGVLMLVGIVLTNAVVLVTVVEQLRKTGMDDKEALITGSQTRLRPILMTALTTMIAMLPLAFGGGEGLIMAADLATVVIGGLFSSTLLTLLVVPVLYAMTHRAYRSKT